MKLNIICTKLHLKNKEPKNLKFGLLQILRFFEAIFQPGFFP